MTDHDKAEIVRRYTAGASVSLLVLDTDLSRREIERILLDAGVELRGRKGNGRHAEHHPRYIPTPEEIERETKAIRLGLIPGIPGWSEEERIKRSVTKVPPVYPQQCRLPGVEQRGNYGPLGTTI